MSSSTPTTIASNATVGTTLPGSRETTSQGPSSLSRQNWDKTLASPPGASSFGDQWSIGSISSTEKPKESTKHSVIPKSLAAKTAESATHLAVEESGAREKKDRSVSGSVTGWLTDALGALWLPKEDIPFADTPQSYFDKVRAKNRKR